jgi:FkbM family methyltransferase
LNLKNNFGKISMLMPYRHALRNKQKLFRSILLGKSSLTIDLINGESLIFPSKDLYQLIDILNLISFATDYSIQEDKIRFSFDTVTYFELPLFDLTYEEKNLWDILVVGTRYGANFITDDIDISNYRDKTFKILDIDGKKIIETYGGVRFFIDSIHPGNSIIECFVNNIHQINANDNLKGKTVVDVGAECGDTPLYFASKGAKVYAFEPIKANFDAMLRNISLNPHLKENIIPINAAIGKDGELEFFQSPDNPDIGSSFVYNMYGNKAQTTKVQGYSYESALTKFGIDHVDLLKTDCKGCEFFLTPDALKKIDRVKIEYITAFSKDRLTDLLDILQKSNFEFMIYRINPLLLGMSNKVSGHIFARKKH